MVVRLGTGIFPKAIARSSTIRSGIRYMSHAHASPDDIARLVHERFDRLPTRCKPRSAGIASRLTQREWVPLAGIVAEDTSSQPPSLQCVCLATGMKCMPETSLINANGNVTHDSHAEVLTLRSLNRLLLEQCRTLTNMKDGAHPSGPEMMLVERVHSDLDPTTPRRPFRIRPSIRLHMYCSDCPCGDASMELVMSRQVDATPWQAPIPTTTVPDQASTLPGRGHFDQLGVVRRKPSRADAPVSMSKSCTDKLALKQYTSVLSGVTSLFIKPGDAYLHQLIIPESQHVPKAIARAFGGEGRLAVAATWPEQEDGLRFRPFQVATTSMRFAFARTTVADSAESQTGEPKASNIACVSYRDKDEIIINGVLQGRKVDDPKGAPSVSRRRMWGFAKELAGELGDGELQVALEAEGYGLLKAGEGMRGRNNAKDSMLKAVLRGWTRSTCDRSWGLN